MFIAPPQFPVVDVRHMLRGSLECTFKVRVTPGLEDAVRQFAGLNNVSLNRAVVELLALALRDGSTNEVSR